MQSAPAPVVPPPKGAPVPSAGNDSPDGLTNEEAGHRLTQFGPNALPDTSWHPIRRVVAKFWSPVPWLLEGAMLLELCLDRWVEAGIIAVLLLFNAGADAVDVQVPAPPDGTPWRMAVDTFEETPLGFPAAGAEPLLEHPRTYLLRPRSSAILLARGPGHGDNGHAR